MMGLGKVVKKTSQSNTRQNRRVVWLCLPILYFILVIALWLFYQPVLFIEVSSNTAGTSELFYKTVGGSYSDKWVVNQSMSTGRQLMAFQLPYYRDPLRWDPPNKPGSFQIHDMWMQVGWLHFGIHRNSLVGARHIERIAETSEGIHVLTSNNAFDPQLTFTVDARRIDRWRLGVCLIVATFITILIAIALIYRSRIGAWSDRIDQVLIRLITSLKGESFGLSEFAILMGIVLALNLYSLSSFSLSIDDEFAVFRDRPDVWIGQGRWTAYLIERLIFPQPVMPFVPNFIFCLLITFGYMLLSRSHGLSRDWRTYLLFPVFCGFPVWWFIAEFYANLPSIGLGVLLVSASIFVFARSENRLASSRRTEVILTVIQAILLATAIGAYQSLLLMHVAMGLGIVLVRLLFSDKTDGQDIRVAIWRIVRLGMVASLGLVIYQTINAYAQWLVPSRSEYLEGFWRLDDLIRNPAEVISGVFKQMGSFYSGDPSTYGVSLGSVAAVVAASGVFLLMQFWGHGSLVLSALLWVAILFTPFILNLVSGGIIDSRSLVAVPYVVWLMAILLLKSRRLVLVTVALAIILSLELQIVKAIGTYAAISFIAQEHDRMLATDLYRRISELDERFNRDQEILVDFYGTKNVETPYPYVWSSTMGASFFDWDGGNPWRMVEFMRLLGYTNIGIPDTERRLQMTPIFEAMPKWPAPESVRKVDGVFLIKLGDNPDPVHTRVGSEGKK